MRQLTTPLTEEVVKSLHAGDQVLLSGIVYTARDAAHLRMMDCLKNGEPLPLPLEGNVIYYAGPTPTPEASPSAPSAPPPPPAWTPRRRPCWPMASGA